MFASQNTEADNNKYSSHEMPPKLYYSEILNSSLQTRISSNIPVENVLTSYSNLFIKKSSLLAASPGKAGSNLVEIRIPKNINEIRLEVLDESKVDFITVLLWPRINILRNLGPFVSKLYCNVLTD